MNELEFVRSELGAMGPTPVCCSAESPVDLMCCLVKIVSFCYIINVVDPPYCFYVDLCCLLDKVCIVEGV